MADLLDDIETRMFALDRALPDNAAARDLLEILHRCRAEIGRLRTALNECWEYFDQRADVAAYSDETGHTPNEEMRLMQEIDDVLPSPGEHGDGDG